MPQIRVLEVATFYTMFKLEPVGQHATSSSAARRPACCAAPNELRAVLERRIGEQQHVTPDGAVLLAGGRVPWRLLNAPMVQINDDYYEDLTARSFESILDDLAAGRRRRRVRRSAGVVRAVEASRP